MTCFQCGAPVPEGSRFCGRCGVEVSDPQVATLLVEGASGEAELERLRMVFAGEFELVRELARGGMGVVYVANELASGRTVALKVLAPGLGTAPRSAERFKRESRVVAELEHPNIVPVYRVGQIGGVMFIAMKLVEGRSLEAILRTQGPLPVPVAVHALRAAARALAHAHKRAVVHRDVKSANLLVEWDGRVLMSDFGVALHAADVTITQPGSVIGTPAYMSPEQCMGRRAGPQSDQYSLGIVTFEMLAGAVPFESDTIAGYINHHLHTPPPDLQIVRDDIPPGLLAILHRLLAKQPGDRYATSAMMLEAIESVSFTEQDRRQGEDTLHRLARGADVQRVRTRSLPDISDARTVVVAAAPRRRRRWAVVAWTGVGAVTVAAGAAIAAGRFGAEGLPSAAPMAARPAAARSTPPADSVTAAADSVTGAGDSVPGAADSIRPASPEPIPEAPAATAALRLLTTPATAEIMVDGRRVGVGGVFDVALRAGARRLQVRARGYVPFDTTLAVGAGDIVNLGRIVLTPRGGGP